jgi:hypothetical protein
MLSVTNEPFKLSGIMLDGIMLNAVVPLPGHSWVTVTNNLAY